MIESELTEIADDRLRFRGHDAIALATSRSFEEVASLLWTGVLSIIIGLIIGCLTAWRWVADEDRQMRDEREDGDA